MTQGNLFTLSVVCVAALLSSEAAAETRKTCKSGEVVVDDGDVIELRLNPGSTSTLYFAGPITNAIHPEWPGVEVQRNVDHLTIHPRFLPRGTDDLGGFPVETAAGSVIIALRAAATPADADERCRVVPRTHRRLDLAAKQVAAQMCAAELAEQSHEIASLRQQFASATEWVLAEEMFVDEIRIPIDDPVPDDPWGVHIQAVAWVIKNGRTHLLFMVHNRGDQPYLASDVQLLNTDSTHAHVKATLLRRSSRATADPRAIATYPARVTTRGVLRIADDAQWSGRLVLYMTQPQGKEPVLGRPIPGPDQALEAMRLAEARRQRRRDAVGRVSVEAQLLRGITWIDEGIDQRELIGSASINGMGVRVVYGFNERLAFEAEAVGAMIGTARFDALEIGSMQGDLLRRATMGRAGFGGVLRFGHEVAPTFRLGLGAQGASYSSQLALSDGSMVPVADRFRVDALINFGVGIDLRLGDHWLAGLNTSAVAPLGGCQSGCGFEMGVRVGYGWTSGASAP